MKWDATLMSHIKQMTQKKKKTQITQVIYSDRYMSSVCLSVNLVVSFVSKETQWKG